MRQPRGMDQALDTTRGLGDVLALRRRFTDGTGGRDSSQPTSGTIEGAPKNQTPSRAEHGPEDVLLFKRPSSIRHRWRRPTEKGGGPCQHNGDS